MRNVFAKLNDDAPVNNAITDEVVIVEAILEASEKLSEDLADLELSMMDFNTKLETIDEIEVYVATIEEAGIDKGLATMAIKTGWGSLFEDSAVSLQGLIDGTDDAEEVKVHMLASVGDVIKKAKENVAKLLTALWEKLKAVLASFFDFSVKYQNALNKLSGWDKADWGAIKDKKLGLAYSGDDLISAYGKIQELAAALASTDKFPAPEQILGAWALKNGSYSRTKSDAPAKGKTVAENGYEKNASAIFKGTGLALKAVADLRDKITAIEKAKTDAVKAIKETKDDGYKEAIKAVKMDSLTHISAIKAAITETKMVSSSAVKVLKVAAKSAKKEKKAD